MQDHTNLDQRTLSGLLLQLIHRKACLPISIWKKQFQFSLPTACHVSISSKFLNFLHGIEDIYQILLAHLLAVLRKSLMFYLLSANDRALISTFWVAAVIDVICLLSLWYQSPPLKGAELASLFYLWHLTLPFFYLDLVYHLQRLPCAIWFYFSLCCSKVTWSWFSRCPSSLFVSHILECHSRFESTFHQEYNQACLLIFLLLSIWFVLQVLCFSGTAHLLFDSHWCFKDAALSLITPNSDAHIVSQQLSPLQLHLDCLEHG